MEVDHVAGPGVAVRVAAVDPAVRVPSIVHLYSIVRDVHLIPVFWGTQMPIDFNFSYSLDAFEHFHVNKYADYYSFECIILNTNHDVIDCS